MERKSSTAEFHQSMHQGRIVIRYSFQISLLGLTVQTQTAKNSQFLNRCPRGNAQRAGQANR